MSILRIAVFAAVPFLLPAAEGLEAIKADPDPQRRYRAALEYSSQQVTAARKAYEEGKPADYAAALKQAVDAVKLCDDTLREPGKNRVRNATHFKRAELKTREIIRRIEQLEKEAAVDDRAPAHAAALEIRKIHDQILTDLMGRNRIK